jgi:hypothetical protein
LCLEVRDDFPFSARAEDRVERPEPLLEEDPLEALAEEAFPELLVDDDFLDVLAWTPPHEPPSAMKETGAIRSSNARKNPVIGFTRYILDRWKLRC